MCIAERKMNSSAVGHALQQMAPSNKKGSELTLSLKPSSYFTFSHALSCAFGLWMVAACVHTTLFATWSRLVHA